MRQQSCFLRILTYWAWTTQRSFLRKKRNELFDAIIEKAVCYGIGQKDQQVIDDINILEATKLAMIEAIENAEKMLEEKLEKQIDFVLFDAMKIDAVENRSNP